MGKFIGSILRGIMPLFFGQSPFLKAYSAHSTSIAHNAAELPIAKDKFCFQV
jgi:hypothetical protein